MRGRATVREKQEVMGKRRREGWGKEEDQNG